MRDRLRHGEEDRQRPAEPAAPVDQAGALALQLQRTVGNQATARLLQRFGAADLIVGPGLRASLEWIVWPRIVRSNRESSSAHGIDPAWRELAFLYSHENPADGKWIRMGLARMPSFWVGSWILERAGSETHAITLDEDVFFNPATDGEPNVDTYVHELVHVAQYGILGITGFLGSYAQEFVEEYIGSGGDDAAAYHQIAHERQAAAVEERFTEWRLKKEKADAEDAARRPNPIKDAEDAMRPPSPISEIGPFALTGSVGAKGDNRPEDVERVAGRLHGLGFLASMTTDIAAVTEAIERYQSEVLGWPGPDGRVDVDNKTHRALKAGRKTVSMQLP
jgi:hypothetical protein